MNSILIFMGFCLILGLWIKPHVRYGLVIVMVAAFLLVIFLWLFPSKL